jgi:ABC-2 type transport system ATP-binding protein
MPLVVDRAVKRFGAVQALAGASFSLGRGELLGLLGPNGAGKTTLIRAIAGRLPLDGGGISLYGEPVRRGRSRPEVGVVPQELGIYPLLTARENLEIFGRLYGVSPRALAGRVDWALAWSGLADRASEPTRRFSGGMRRRLNIACSLVHEPSVVLLDEPTVGVDPQSRERIYEMLAALRSAGVSILLTTHHLEEAELRCDRIVIIDQGRTVASGTVAELLQASGGGGRTLRLSLAQPLAEGAALPENAFVDDDRRTLTAHVDQVGRDVPALLAALTAAGADVSDMALAGASLQDAFIALTGRELRE